MMEESGASQLSLTDADAKLMKNKNGFAEYTSDKGFQYDESGH